MSNSAEIKTERKFEELFREYFASLCYFAQKYISDQDAAREIVHTVFVSVWDKRAEFDFEKPAKSYLFTSVYNRCMNYIRDRRKFDTEGDEAIANDLGTPDPDYLAAAELESRIWKVIDTLPEKCRQVFVLNRFEEKKYAEIADLLKISVKTVETQMSKALRVLRSELADYLMILWLFVLKNIW